MSKRSDSSQSVSYSYNKELPKIFIQRWLYFCGEQSDFHYSFCFLQKSKLFTENTDFPSFWGFGGVLYKHVSYKVFLRHENFGNTVTIYFQLSVGK